MNKIFLTRPVLPDFNDFNKIAHEIYQSKMITNMGEKHNLLESRLKEELAVNNLSLFNNGTIALLVALKALDLPQGSEVITTPFTFAATPHCISWNGLKPVFCDIDPKNMTIDADKIEKLITPNTSAILAVHVFGFPCNIQKIEEIAKKHQLKVIYDAAHAFSTKIDNIGIGNFGDITMFSFHATKLFNTIEGGCLTYNDNALKTKISRLRNFGIVNEEEVELVGINGKMNEFQSAIGLLNLQIYQKEQQKRQKIKEKYDSVLSGISGIHLPRFPENVSNSYQYYPIIIEESFSISRNELYDRFKEQNILVRKYFYPACTDYQCYKTLEHTDLPATDNIKNKILCLPFYGDLTDMDTDRILSVIQKILN